MRNRWKDISYLASGNAKQQQVFAAITNSKILEILAPYEATVVSTICLAIDTPESDIDIICHTSNSQSFYNCCWSTFRDYQEFSITSSDKFPIIVRFTYLDFNFEIYGSATPVEQQNAYRHLSVAARIIECVGDQARVAIQNYKQQGLKTEPAIAKLLKLSGDPYKAVLAVEDWSDQKIITETRSDKI